MIDSQKLNSDVATALGLDPETTRSIDLHFRAGELVTCDVTQIVNVGTVGEELKKHEYILTPTEHPPAEAGAGWRLLEPNERIEVGDQFFPKGCGVTWTNTKVGGHNPSKTPKGEGYTYRRRKIEWREVAVGEVVRPGDEVYCGSVWLLSSMGDWGMPVRQFDRFRRRGENCVEVGGGWRQLKDGECVVGGDEVFVPAVYDRPCRWIRATIGVYTRGSIYRRVDVGDGWRRLGQDEVVQWGDEYYVSDAVGWLPTTHFFGDGLTPRSEGSCYRRAGPTAGKGWRLLARDEITEAGDEVWISVGWIPLCPTGDPSGDKYIHRRRCTDDLDRLKAELASERKKSELLDEEVARLRHANEQMHARLPTLEEQECIRWCAKYADLVSGLGIARVPPVISFLKRVQ